MVPHYPLFFHSLCRMKSKIPQSGIRTLHNLTPSTTHLASSYLIFTSTSYALAVLNNILPCLRTSAMLFSLHGMLLPASLPPKKMFKGILIKSSLNSQVVMSLFRYFLICTSTIIIIFYCTCYISFSKYLLSAYNMPGTFLNAGHITMNKNRSLPTQNCCIIQAGETNIINS